MGSPDAPPIDGLEAFAGEVSAESTGRHDHPILAEAPIARNGVRTSELAVADPVGGTVTVFVGNQIVFHLNGLSHPSDIKLADLNDDGVADLIVADSGNNRVLVFPGLASGGFGSELNAGAGFTVGTDPVDLTVGDLNGDGRLDLLVTNRGSNDVSVLLGRGTAASWTLDRSSTIAAGTDPVRTALYIPEGQVNPCVAICNHGSNDVYLYNTGPGGQVDDQSLHVVDVGNGPSDMFVGPIAHRSEVDMVTVDDAHNLSYLGNILGDHPTRQVFTTAGASILSAFPFTSTTTGLTDMLVAGSDGQLSILQAGPSGIQLTDLTAPTGLGVVSAFAAGQTNDGSTLDLFEAIGTGDLIAEYQLDLATLLAATADAGDDPTIAGTDDGLTWELLPTGSGSMLDLVGVLWNGPTTRSGRQTDPALDQTDSARSTPTGSVSAAGGPSTTSGGDVHPSGDEAEGDSNRSAEVQVDAWTRYVLGLDAAFDSLQTEVAALSPADLDAGASGRTESQPSRLPSSQLIARSVGFGGDLPADLALDRDSADPRLEVPAAEARRPVRVNPSGPATAGPGAERPSELVTAAVGSAVAVRLLINASPPRPPRTRGERRPGTVAPWPELIPPTSPHA